jgi:SUKH-3 immunity protein
MDLTELSSHALHVLRAQGWDGSEQNIESDLADLKEEGFDTLPSYVISILKKYSGLEFEAISEYTQSRLEISFGLDKALEIPCVKKNLIEHEIILGKKLYPIGSIDLSELNRNRDFGRLIIVVADDGNVYSSMSYVINQTGYDINDFINRVIDDQLLWRTDKSLKVSYSRHDPRLRELRKKELVEEAQQ